MLKKAVATAKKYYQYILSAALIMLLVSIIYLKDLEILANEAFQSEALSHILLIPFFAGILFYLKKDMVKASLDLEKLKRTKTRHVDELVGLTLCITAFLTYWYGSYTFYPLEYHFLSLPIFILGVTLILFNLKAMLTLLLPTLFLLFLTPPPTELLYGLGGTMGNFNTQVSYTLLKTFGLPVALSTSYGPPTIMLRGEPFTVDLACSGIYSLMAFAMFAAFLALVASAPLVKKVGIAIIGFITFEALNVIRITATISVANQFGRDIAMNLFHTLAGVLLIFTGMLLTLILADKLLKIQIIPTPKETTPCPECETSANKLRNFCTNCGRSIGRIKPSVSKQFWTKLLLLMLGCFMVTLSINAPTFAVAQAPIGIRYAANLADSANAFPNITGYRPPTFLYRDANYEAVAQQDASLWYVYSPTNISEHTVYVDMGVANSISNLHNWEVCLVSWQTAQGQYPLVTVLDSRDTPLLQDVPIIARYFTFTSPENYTQTTLYWYERATFNTGITVEQKYVRISLIILTNSTDTARVEDELLPIGQSIASYWEPLRNEALISLGIPTLQALLAASILLVAFTQTTMYLSRLNKKNTNQKLFDKIASTTEKEVLRTIQNVSKEKKRIRTLDIQEELEKKMGNSMTTSRVLEILKNLEQSGLVQKDIASTDSKPLLVWKV